MGKNIYYKEGNSYLRLALLATLFVGLSSLGYFSKEIAFFII